MRNALHQKHIEIVDPLLITNPSSSAKKIEQKVYSHLRKGEALCGDVYPKFRPAKDLANARARIGEIVSAVLIFPAKSTGAFDCTVISPGS